MPELPEVETVRRTLKGKVLGKRIKEVVIRYDGIVEYPSVLLFREMLVNEEVKDIHRRGKWLIFEFNSYYLLSHLRMEGKYYFKDDNTIYDRHEHVVFKFLDNTRLSYYDTRKFGKMILISKSDLGKVLIDKHVGLEPWDEGLTSSYLKDIYSSKNVPIKTVLLDQSIIAGIGNIYADEILFLSGISPLRLSCDIKLEECNKIILNTRKVLQDAINKGGTTIRSYTSDYNVRGQFQNDLQVHERSGLLCYKCGNLIKKIKVGGRGSYFCDNCQK